jgi:hypothetical protein
MSLFFDDATEPLSPLFSISAKVRRFNRRGSMRRTSETDAIELAMLLVLITILSPISWLYYGVWLLYPFAIVAQFIESLSKVSMTK